MVSMNLMAAGMVDLFDKLKEGRYFTAVSHNYGIDVSFLLYIKMAGKYVQKTSA